jgi:hypothetical protein
MDIAQCNFSKGLPVSWCKMFGGIGQYSYFALSWCGKDGSVTLGLRWCQRMQFFFDVWKVAGDPDCTYPPEDFQGMPVDASWSAFLEKLDPHSKSKARADVIDGFKPRARQSTASGSKELAP